VGDVMSVQQPKRLPKEQRREQLLDTALAIVREQGTDAITLSYVAERAGVSKPIAYGHFGTRAGL
jgi:AcrR family transcriptional regulator